LPQRRTTHKYSTEDGSRYSFCDVILISVIHVRYVVLKRRREHSTPLTHEYNQHDRYLSMNTVHDITSSK